MTGGTRIMCPECGAFIDDEDYTEDSGHEELVARWAGYTAGLGGQRESDCPLRGKDPLRHQWLAGHRTSTLMEGHEARVQAQLKLAGLSGQHRRTLPQPGGGGTVIHTLRRLPMT